MWLLEWCGLLEQQIVTTNCPLVFEKDYSLEEEIKYLWRYKYVYYAGNKKLNYSWFRQTLALGMGHILTDQVVKLWWPFAVAGSHSLLWSKDKTFFKS